MDDRCFLLLSLWRSSWRVCVPWPFLSKVIITVISRKINCFIRGSFVTDPHLIHFNRFDTQWSAISITHKEKVDTPKLYQWNTRQAFILNIHRGSNSGKGLSWLRPTTLVKLFRRPKISDQQIENGEKERFRSRQFNYYELDWNTRQKITNIYGKKILVHHMRF